ncbi:MAG: TonB-dependent receptor [Acidobacteria bacterium]|nr:TonB-dependent receptor [Acidobacteriota bacterium]
MRRFTLCIVALVLVALPAAAQQQYGSVAGAIIDNTQQALPGVSVTLAGPAMQGTRSAVADGEGRYRFVPVPPGSDYTLRFELQGFNTLERTGLVVSLGKETRVDAEMSLSQFAETITVAADRIVVDTTKSTVDTSVDWELVNTLPTNRNFQTMMQMAPGVKAGNNPLVNGASNDGNAYLVDGVDTSDPRTQTWGTAINWDTIAEAQLQTAGFQAEYGRATGGILNLITKSGGNKFSATARLIKSKADWSALNGVEEETGRKKSGGARNDEERPSLTIGGPIVKDALWFFVAGEKRDNSRGFSYYESSADVTAGNQVDGRTEYTGHYLQGKLTFQMGPSHTLVGAYNEDPIELRPLNRGWNETSTTHYAESSELYQFQGGDNASLQWTGILTPNFFMEAKGQFHKQELNVSPDAPGFNEVPYVRDLDTNYRYNAPLSDYQSKRDRNGLLLTGSYFFDTGTESSHQFKGGVEYLALKPKAGTIHNSAGSYEHDADGPVRRWFWLDETGMKESKQDYYALFVQDQWKLGRLTLNLGLRAETTEIFNNQGDSLLKFDFQDQIAPRLGFAYDLNGDSIRGSIGRFYSLASNYIADYFAVSTDHEQQWSWNGTCAVDGRDVWTYGDTCWELDYDLPTGAGGHMIDPNLDPVYVDEVTLGYDHLISDQFAGGVTFVWREQDQAIDWYDPEASGSYYITNVPNGAGYPAFNSTGTYPDVANKKYSEYQALQFNIKKRAGNDNIQFIANYTYVIKSRGWNTSWRNVGAFTFTIPEQMDARWYGETESAHDFKLSGSYTMPWRTIFGMSAFWNSGNVYTPYTYEGGWGYVPLAQRGSLKVGNNWEADVYLEQPFKLGPVTLAAYGNVFNVFNNQQPTSRSGYEFSSLYRLPNGWQNPRRVEFGIKIEY